MIRSDNQPSRTKFESSATYASPSFVATEKVPPKLYYKPVKVPSMLVLRGNYLGLGKVLEARVALARSAQ